MKNLHEGPTKAADHEIRSRLVYKGRAGRSRRGVQEVGRSHGVVGEYVAQYIASQHEDDASERHEPRAEHDPDPRVHPWYRGRVI